MEVATLFVLGAAFMFAGVNVTMALADKLDPEGGQSRAAGEMADLRVPRD